MLAAVAALELGRNDRAASASSMPDGRRSREGRDRDIVLNCVAVGMDITQVKVQDYAGDEAVTIGADDDIEEALDTMARAGVRRLPVIDGHDLVGMISQANIAKNLPEDRAGRPLEAISAAPSTD